MSRVQTKSGNFWGITFLIAGTSIGTGMLGLPISSGLGGFFPALTLTALIWLITLCTGLLFVEALITVPLGTNITTLTRHYFGKIGALLWSTAFFLFNFSIMTSYFAELQNLLGSYMTPLLIALTIWIMCACITFLGVYITDRINLILIAALFISFALLLYMGGNHVTYVHLIRRNWTFSFLAAPALFSAFNFQPIIPLLMGYAGKRVGLMCLSIFSGTFLTFLVYALWQWLTIGSLPAGTIWEAFERSGTLIESSTLLEKTPWLGKTMLFFSFFALLTSMLGVGLLLIDYLGDLFGISYERRAGKNRFWLTGCAFALPVVIASFNANFFLSEFPYLVGIGGTLIDILLPVCAVWIARYHRKEHTRPLLPGGRPLLLLLLLIVFYMVYLQGIRLIQ